MIPPHLPYTIDDIKNVEPAAGEIEVGWGDVFAGEPHKPLIVRHSNARRHLFVVRSPRVLFKNLVLDWNMVDYRDFSTLVRFDTEGVCHDVVLQNVVAINTADTQRGDARGDCWVINFTNKHGCEDIRVENCESWWSNCQLTAGGMSQDEHGVCNVRIEGNYVRGGRSNSIAVSAWQGRRVENVYLLRNHVEFAGHGCFVGRDGPASRGDVKLSNVHLSDNVFRLNRSLVEEIDQAGRWQPRFPKCSLVKGGTTTGVRRVYSSGNLFDTRDKAPWQHPRWLDVTGPRYNETQVFSDDVRVGDGQDTIWTSIEYADQIGRSDYKVKRHNADESN